MADGDVSLKLSVLEKNYVVHGLCGLRDSLKRSIAKEQNPDVVRYRQADLSSVLALLARLGGV